MPRGGTPEGGRDRLTEEGTEDRAGIWPDGGFLGVLTRVGSVEGDWEGWGLGSGGRQGREEPRQHRNIQSPSGHFIMSMSRWTEPQLKAGSVWGLGGFQLRGRFQYICNMLMILHEL